MKKRIKFAIVGLGRISQRHVDAISSFPKKAKLIEVCEKDKKTLDNFNFSSKINKFISFKDLIENSKADYIVLTSPNGLHSSQSIYAAENGFNVVTEKPMSINLKDSLNMIKAFKNANKKLFVVKQVRLLERIKLLKQAIDEEHFGKIFLSSFNLFWSRPQSFFDEASWRGTKKLDGGMLYNQAIHYIDLMSWLLGPVESLNCFSKTLSRNIECEDTSIINLNFKSGSMGSFNSTILTYPKNLECSFTIIGEKGTVKIGGSALDKIEIWDFEDSFGKDLINKDKENFNHGPFYEGLLKEENENINFPFKGEDALPTIQIIDAALKSAEIKKPIIL